jgi:DNA-binding Xre family transcriptional regulator
MRNNNLCYADFIGMALKVMRKRRGLSQSDLATKLSAGKSEALAQSYISRIEAAPKPGVRKAGVSMHRLAEFCLHLSCEASEVVMIAESFARNAND